MANGFLQRLARLQRQRRVSREQDMLREAEVGQCSECGNIYPWDKLKDFSTQTYMKVLCPKCIQGHDPRARV